VDGVAVDRLERALEVVALEGLDHAPVLDVGVLERLPLADARDGGRDRHAAVRVADGTGSQPDQVLVGGGVRLDPRLDRDRPAVGAAGRRRLKEPLVPQAEATRRYEVADAQTAEELVRRGYAYVSPVARIKLPDIVGAPGAGPVGRKRLARRGVLRAATVWPAREPLRR
jgi:hypothetical protein